MSLDSTAFLFLDQLKFIPSFSGFGFVCMVKVEDSYEALRAMNGVDVDGRNIRVEKAKRTGGYQKTPGICKFYFIRLQFTNFHIYAIYQIWAQLN